MTGSRQQENDSLDSKEKGGPEKSVSFFSRSGQPCSASGHTVLETGPAAFYRQSLVGDLALLGVQDRTHQCFQRTSDAWFFLVQEGLNNPL